MNDDPAARCSLCGALVLGLAGQDWCALPWMLDDDADVRPGSCHVRCLEERGEGPRWAEAVEAYHLARWPLWLAGRDGGARWRLHCGPPARRFHLWRSDGRLSSFPYAALRHDPPLLVTELAEVGSGHAAQLLTAMGEVGGDVPLARVVDALGLTDHYPLRLGTVAARVRSVGTAISPEVADVLVARYPLPLAAGCRRAAHALLRGTV